MRKQWTLKENVFVYQYLLDTRQDFNEAKKTLAKHLGTTISSINCGIKNALFYLSEGAEGLSGFNDNQRIALDFICEQRCYSKKLLMAKLG
jgi:hypothetical protein